MIDQMTEKHINANLNIWCRQPGILAATILMYQAWLLGNYGAPHWAMLLNLILPPYNAQYYAKQATANYAVHYMLTLLGQDDLIKCALPRRHRSLARASGASAPPPRCCARLLSSRHVSQGADTAAHLEDDGRGGHGVERRARGAPAWLLRRLDPARGPASHLSHTPRVVARQIFITPCFADAE
jgi:hypothetical protein